MKKIKKPKSPITKKTVKVLDRGQVIYIEHWGSDEMIIEAARMSTAKGFLGWGTPEKPGDERLLKYLYNNRHMTPFEQAGLTIEVKAPIMVFREWHRHRTQSYNEMSGRYVPLPNEDYMPTLQRITDGIKSAGANKQAAGVGVKIGSDRDFIRWLNGLAKIYQLAQDHYEAGLAIGVPKELARLPVTVARYSRMRASANLRNWLQFTALRADPTAQWEIRQYAFIVRDMLSKIFPRTLALAMQKTS